MKAIDTHCHLQHTLKRGAKLGALVENAKKVNVMAMIDSPVYVKDYQQSIRFHQTYPKEIFVTLGVPPAQYHELDIDQIIEKMRIFAKKEEIVAIGEVGLDYYWVKKTSLREKQHEIFLRFIKLANDLRLPIVIHSRDAEKEAIDILQKEAETKVVMHSFAGSVETALESIDNGFYISIPTCVTNRKKHRRIAERIPLDYLITETDSPYLSPFKDKKRNEPSYVIEAVKEIAKIKEVSIEEVSEITTKNAIEIFDLKL